MKPKYLLFASFGFFILLQFLFSLDIAPLADDLAHYADIVKLRRGELSEMDIFRNLFNDPNRYARPMSPIILGTMMVLSQYASFLFFFWGILFIIPAYLLYKIINKYFGNEWIAVLASILVLLFPLSSSNHFSPVMQSVQSVVFAFILSCYLCDRKGIYNYLIIGGLSTFSLLLYELNLFIFPILILLIWINNKEKKYLKIFIATILPIVLAFVYKTYFVKIIYLDYFNYSSSKIYLGVDKISGNIIALIKLFFLDYPYIVYKSITMIRFYDILDFTLLSLGIIISIIFSIKIDIKHRVHKTHLVVCLLFFILTICVFFISQYPAVAFGFENRILLWVRFSSMLLLSTFLYNLLYYSREKKVLNTLIRGIISLILFSFFISIISQKKSWILASKYNESIIKNLSTHFQENQEDTKILYVKDYRKRELFTTDESTLEADYEIEAALQLYSSANFQTKNILFFNPTYYSLYNIENIELNKRPKTEYNLTENGIKIGKNFFSYPFFIYDERDNSIIKVNNQQEFNIK